MAITSSVFNPFPTRWWSFRVGLLYTFRPPRLTSALPRQKDAKKKTSKKLSSVSRKTILRMSLIRTQTRIILVSIAAKIGFSDWHLQIHFCNLIIRKRRADREMRNRTLVELKIRPLFCKVSRSSMEKSSLSKWKFENQMEPWFELKKKKKDRINFSKISYQLHKEEGNERFFFD